VEQVRVKKRPDPEKRAGVSAATCICLAPALWIGDLDLRTSNERRDDLTSDERHEKSDGLDLGPSSMDRLVEAALRDMPIILETTTLVY
jgi:hypothetical protein